MIRGIQDGRNRSPRVQKVENVGAFQAQIERREWQGVETQEGVDFSMPTHSSYTRVSKRNVLLLQFSLSEKFYFVVDRVIHRLKFCEFLPR